MNVPRSIDTAMIRVSQRGKGRGLWRSRWAAVGAAVAVTLGGGGLVAVNAASSVPSAIVTIDPVRILDTRTDVGLPGPFVSAISQKLQVTGASVPAGATGVLMNVTAVAPTADGFLSIRPGDATGAPSTSSLNVSAGAVVPNSVQVGLPTSGANAGKIDITFDAYGVAGPTTEVLIDVVGYMVAGAAGPAGPAGPVDPALSQRIDAVESQLTLLGARQPVVEYAAAIDEVDLAMSAVSDPELIVDPATELLSVTINAPTAGKVAIVAHATAKSGEFNTGFSRLVCQITNNPAATTIDGQQELGIASPATGGSQPSLGTNRVYNVVAGPNTFDLMCAATGGLITIHYRSMSATFTPG